MGIALLTALAAMPTTARKLLRAPTGRIARGNRLMRHLLWIVMTIAALAPTVIALPAAAQEAQEQTDPLAELPWQVGPTKAAIGGRATIDIPDGYAFLGAEGTRQLDILLENPPLGVDQYTVAPVDLAWLGYLNFSEVGYVKDNESLDADDLLASIREGTEQSNVERRDRGWETLNILGWSFKPQYDEQIKALEWAVLAETGTSKSRVVNYNTRLLGRRGVMEVVVVAAPERIDASIADFKGLLPGYAFAAGEKYAEFQAGDHVAEFGLAALITGGAAAVASKKGFFAAIALFLAKAWKLVIIGLVGIGAVARKFFTGRGDKQP